MLEINMGKKDKTKKQKIEKSARVLQSTLKVKKIKTIQLNVEWEEKIKASYIGSVANFITQAIYEKMVRDGIL